MSYAVIMVHVEIDDGSEARLRLAVQLARRFSTTLIGLSAAMVPAEALDGGVATLLAAREETFRKLATAAGIKHEWRAANDLPEDAVAREARAADLVIVGRTAASASVLRAVDAGRVVLRAGRPVLVVPSGIESLAAERIVIGWKDTREARRAIQDALPFLHEAKRVRVAEMPDMADETNAQRRLDDVVLYLMRHRIAADTRVLSQAEPDVGAALLRVAQQDGADLIVTGAYGQSRPGEWVFGGATRSLLAASAVCCLLAH